MVDDITRLIRINIVFKCMDIKFYSSTFGLKSEKRTAKYNRREQEVSFGDW